MRSADGNSRFPCAVRRRVCSRSAIANDSSRKDACERSAGSSLATSLTRFRQAMKSHELVVASRAQRARFVRDDGVGYRCPSAAVWALVLIARATRGTTSQAHSGTTYR